MRERDVDDGRYSIGDPCQHSLCGIHPLQALVEKRAEQPDQQHALRRAEVTPVSGGRQYPRAERRAEELAAIRCAAVRLLPAATTSSKASVQPRLDHDEDACNEDQ